jgi:hypothetical protein
MSTYFSQAMEIIERAHGNHELALAAIWPLTQAADDVIAAQEKIIAQLLTNKRAEE